MCEMSFVAVTAVVTASRNLLPYLAGPNNRFLAYVEVFRDAL